MQLLIHSFPFFSYFVLLVLSFHSYCLSSFAFTLTSNSCFCSFSVCILHFPFPLFSSFTFTSSFVFSIPILPSILSPCTSPLPLHVLTLTVFHVLFIIFLIFLTSVFLCIFCSRVFHILLFLISILVYIISLLQILCLLPYFTALFAELCSRI